MDEAQKQWSLSATETSETAEPKGIPQAEKSTIALP